MSLLPTCSSTCSYTRLAMVALPALLAFAPALAQTGSAATSPPNAATTTATINSGGATAARCASLSGEFQAACEVRIMGAGSAGSATAAATGTHAAVKIATEPPPKASEPESSADASVPTVVVPLPNR